MIQQQQKKHTKLKNKFNKVAGCKIHIQKLVAILYTNNELFVRETKKTEPFTIASNKIKYIEINLTHSYSQNTLCTKRLSGLSPALR